MTGYIIHTGLRMLKLITVPLLLAMVGVVGEKSKLTVLLLAAARSSKYHCWSELSHIRETAVNTRGF